MKSLFTSSFSLALCLTCLFLTTTASAQNQNSFLITGAKVIDGSGTAGKLADVRVRDGRILAVGKLKPAPNEKQINGKGLTLTPGFIDLHNHSESGLLSQPSANSQVLQGITTLAVGPDGGSPFPLSDYLGKLAAQHTSLNVMAFIGHATVRHRVMGEDYKRAATADEIAKMEKLVEQGMRDGAVGISTGLEYDIGYPSQTEEVIALSRVAAKYGGIYMSHIRDESDVMLDALREAIRIGREARIPVQISHIKLGTVAVWNKASEVNAMVKAAQREGIDITADCYPYDAWHSTITVLVPSRKHDDPAMVKRGLDDVGGAQNVLVARCSKHPEYEGKTLAEIAQQNHFSTVDAYIKIVNDGGANVICRSMQETDMKAFYQQPWVMVASDGGINGKHPRGAGTFPRVLGRYVREQKWITLPEAIRKMTSMPAQRVGLSKRGLIRPGYQADLVLFDANKVIDRATMTSPLLEPEGIVHVFVNGQQVVENGKVTPNLPGEIIKNQKGK